MYKYHNEIQSLNECKIQCPPEDLFAFEGKMYRFVHESRCGEFRNNNLPVTKINPSRRLKDENLQCIAHASLSCFETEKQAEMFILKKSNINKNIYKSVGCCIGEFKVNEADGARTVSNKDGHFSFFEFEGADFDSKYNIIHKLKECNP